MGGFKGHRTDLEPKWPQITCVVPLEPAHPSLVHRLPCDIHNVALRSPPQVRGSLSPPTHPGLAQYFTAAGGGRCWSMPLHAPKATHIPAEYTPRQPSGTRNEKAGGPNHEDRREPRKERNYWTMSSRYSNCPAREFGLPLSHHESSPSSRAGQLEYLEFIVQ